MKSLTPERAYLWQSGYTHARGLMDDISEMTLTDDERDSEEFKAGSHAGKKQLLIDLIKQPQQRHE